jgi:GGDEF domain-containing protein
MEQLTDPLTGFGSRRALIAALTEAASPGQSPTTFALFDLGGLREYSHLYGRLEGETLVARVAARLADALNQVGRYYRPRAEELAALLEGRLSETEPLLLGATAALSDRFSQFELGLSFGATTVPDEAADPIEALVLADRRLSLTAPARRPRERRARSRGERPSSPG